MTQRTRVVAIVGSRSSKTVPKAMLQRLLGGDVHVYYASRAIGASEVAVQVGTNNQVVCICGGDGTVSDVINGLWRLRLEHWPLLVIFPAGTSNILARHFGCHTFALAACAAFHGTRVPLNIAELTSDVGNRRIAVVSVSTGAMATACIVAEAARCLGRSRIAIGEVLARFSSGRYRVRLRGETAFAANGYHYWICHVAQRFRGRALLPDDSSHGGAFVVSQTVKRPTRPAFLWPRPVRHSSASRPVLSVMRDETSRTYDVATDLRVEHAGESTVCVDGDAWGTGSFDLHALATDLRVLTPNPTCSSKCYLRRQL